MPHSLNSFDNILLEHIRHLKPSTILDVGVGSGKHGTLLRNSGYAGRLDGIEPTEQYRIEFDLSNRYNTVFPVTLQDFVNTTYKFNYDVALFGDVLEHLFRSEVIDYIDYFLYKCKWIIIVWPSNLPQHDEGNNPYEIHKSNFTLNDLTQKFDVQYYVKNFAYFDRGNPHLAEISLNYAVIRGYTTPRNASIYNFPLLSTK